MTKYALIPSILLAGALTGACGDRDPESSKVESVAATAILVETGELQAVNSKVVAVPRFKHEYTGNGRAKLVWLEEEGRQVKAGATVALLDTSGVMRVKVQKQADLDIALADLEKLKAEQDTKAKELSADLQSAQAALKLAQIDTQRAQYESDVAKEIKRLGLKIAQIEVDKIASKIIQTQNVHREELLIQQQKIRQTRSAIATADRTIRRFSLRAPADGMVEHYRRGRRREKVQVGGEYWQGRPIVKLPDLSQMKVLTTVNETDISKIAMGQKVLVRLDAYPKVAFEGKITTIGVTSREKEEKSKIRVFDLEVLLQKADPILKPGMTVSCEIFREST
jgi:multidrug efflux pump subunit AcrA (membrane-fusion protein)